MSFLKTSLFKTSFWMGTTTLIKAGLTYVMWKIIAMRVGPAGIAVIEQYQNFIQISRVSIPAGLNEGVVKYVSEYHDNEIKKSDVLSNVTVMHIVICVIALIVLSLFSKELSYLVFQTVIYQKMIILAGAGIVLFIINNLSLSILNAEMEIKKFVIGTLANTIFNFVLTTLLIMRFGLLGGLVGFSLNQTLVAILTASLVIRSKFFKLKLFFSKINWACVKKLLRYSCIPLSTALICPLASLILTKYVVHALTWTNAGYWQALMRLSSGYLIIMGMVFGFYFIPKFSSLKSIAELKKEVIKAHYYIFPLILLGVIFVFIFKKPIVTIMYSKAFLPMIPLFKYQLIGDVSRAGTWILKNILTAKAMVKTCIVLEVVFTSIYIFLTILFVHYDGLIGTAIAFAITYAIFWITMIVFSVGYLKNDR